jgi:hypothetical protein
MLYNKHMVIVYTKRVGRGKDFQTVEQHGGGEVSVWLNGYMAALGRSRTLKHRAERFQPAK